jgi:sugar lactone lactonase YvrE
VLAAGPGFLFVDEAGGIRELAQPATGGAEVRMNDGACDPQGRFWAGTMAYDESPGAGSLYRLELDGSCETVLTGLTISNGIGWSPGEDTMYLNDSGTGCVEAFRFDAATGAISERRTLVHVEQPGAVPDGLTVDEDGGIWVALWGGSAVHRYAPDGSLLTRVEIPVERPTSCAFGGPERSTLFVTTARAGLDDAARARQPDAGLLFSIDGLGVRGLPCQPYRGRISA